MMSDKMREDAIREAARNAALDEYFKARPQLMWSRHEECLFEAGFDRAWQAAKSVPVVGEPVAWLVNKPNRCLHFSKSTEVGLNGATQEPLYLAPATSITEAEIERLRKDAGRWEAAVIVSQASMCIPESRSPRANAMIMAYQKAVNSGKDLFKAIDAAIAASKNEA